MTAKGNKLTIRLTKPDGTFMAKITMPFFQATSFKVPLTKEVVNVNKTNMPSAGPYYMTRNNPDRLTQIRQNPFWKKGPGRNRPRNLAGLDVQWNLNEQTLFNQTAANQIDEDAFMPAAEVQGIAKKYGVNKTRFWSKSQNCTGYLPMNTSRSLFKGNTALRQAINYAIDRKSFVSQAGPYAGNTWTHLFNPGVPGWQQRQHLQAEPVARRRSWPRATSRPARSTLATGRPARSTRLRPRSSGVTSSASASRRATST